MGSSCYSAAAGCRLSRLPVLSNLMKNEKAKLITINMGGKTVSRKRAALSGLRTGLLAALKPEQHLDQQEPGAGEQPVQPVHEAQRIGDDPLAAHLVLFGVLVHHLGADQVHGGDHPGKAEPHQGAADDGGDERTGKVQRDERERQRRQRRSPDRHQGELA